MNQNLKEMPTILGDLNRNLLVHVFKQTFDVTVFKDPQQHKYKLTCNDYRYSCYTRKGSSTELITEYLCTILVTTNHL